MKGVIIFCFLSLLFASGIISATTISPSDNEVMSLFEKWKVKHGKVYNGLGEKAKRFEIFKNNLRFIDEHNKNFPNKTYTLGLNVFADLTDDEYQSRYLGTRIDPEEILSTFHDSDEYLRQDGLESLPDSVDWRSKGFVLPIEDQGNCRSGWAFSAVCSVEWTLARSGKLVSLSKQELVDCDKRSNGCNGGDYIYALYYITINGISSEQSYPYEGIDGPCRANDKPKVARIDGYTRISANNEKILQVVVADQVISVVVKSNSPEFKLYESGVYNGPCGDKLDHAVNIVGYGSDDNGVDYWIVRNSWGKGWGEGGYMRIIRNTKNPDGHCGIATVPYYPIPKSGSVGESSF